MGKKYLFPFEDEKKQYPIREIGIIVLCGYIFLVILCLSIIKTAEEQNKIVANTFFKSSPDLIVVPTGDFGRIPKAIEFAKKYSLSNIFISGVYQKNSVDMILPESNFDQIDLNQFEIDYWARNTIENAISTLKYVSDKKDIKRMYDYDNVLESLAPSTFSCTRGEAKRVACGKCWGCNERIWAFGDL